MSLKTFGKRKTSSATPPAKAATTASTPAEQPRRPPSAELSRLHARCSARSERRIRELALDEDTTVQDLILRGLSRLLVERGLEPLEEVADAG
jgi:hypothetical protein